MYTPHVEFHSEINILINILGCLNSFFLSPDQWKSRRIFQEFQGLRQGDPLSPYLCLWNESLLSLNREGCLNGILDGLQNNEYKRYRDACYPLVVADDTFVFCRDSSEEMVHLNWIVLWFEAISV